jgi:hypothetical protein
VSWIAIDDRLYTDPRFISLSGDATKLYVACYTWAGDHLTDGIVTDATVAVLARMYRLKDPEAIVAELLASRLWIAAPEGPVIADYLRLNRTASEVEAARKENREKMAEWRRKKRSNPVTPEPVPVQQVSSNPVTPEPVTPFVTLPHTHTHTHTPDVLITTRRTRKRVGENGFATEDEVRDAEAFALAEELAE